MTSPREMFFRMGRLALARRRPADAAIYRDMVATIGAYAVSPGEAGGVEVSEYVRKTCRTAVHPLLSGLYFGGSEFCSLVEATDSAPVLDLAVLEDAGHLACLVLFERNVCLPLDEDIVIPTGQSGIEEPVLHDTLDVIGLQINLFTRGHVPVLAVELCVVSPASAPHMSFIPLDAMIQRVVLDSSLYTLEQIMPDKEVRLTATAQKTMYAAVATTLGLLSQAGNVFTTKPWKHYTKSEIGEARARGTRKLPVISVISLNAFVARGLREHGDAVKRGPIGQDCWWPVRGHFRMQPCGPKHSLRKQIYVAPHVKGNLAGPMITHVHKAG